MIGISYFYIFLFQFWSIIFILLFKFGGLVIFLCCLVGLLSLIRDWNCLIWTIFFRLTFILRIRLNFFSFVWCLIAWIYYWISFVFFNFCFVLDIQIFILWRIIFIFSMILWCHWCWLIIFSRIIANYTWLIFSWNAIIVFFFNWHFVWIFEGNFLFSKLFFCKNQIFFSCFLHVHPLQFFPSFIFSSSVWLEYTRLITMNITLRSLHSKCS